MSCLDVLIDFRPIVVQNTSSLLPPSHHPGDFGCASLCILCLVLQCLSSSTSTPRSGLIRTASRWRPHRNVGLIVIVQHTLDHVVLLLFGVFVMHTPCSWSQLVSIQWFAYTTRFKVCINTMFCITRIFGVVKLVLLLGIVLVLVNT
jgi:hypothetical protein